MRMIDADATKRRVADTFFDTLIPCVNRALDDSPTIDAVPVVRCKDCKHSELEFFVDNGTIRIEKYKCGNHLGMGMAQEVNADDFCSYGERKEGDD